MKYCIECGNQLVDEAKFCNKCGAKQPLREEKKEEIEAPKPQEAKVESKPIEESIVDAPKEEAKVIAPIPALKEEAPAIEAKPKVEATNKVLSLEDEEYKSKAPAERYRYLMEHDLDFQTVVKASKKRDLMSLSNILYLVVVIVCTFIPYLVFTGNYAHHAGIQILAEEGKSIPHKFGGLELFSFHVTAGNYALAPNSNVTGIYPFVVFLFTFLFLAVMILAAFLGSTKGYRLKEYEKGGIKGLIKGLGGKKNFSGVLVSLFPIVAMATTYISAKDMEYNGDTYLFGEIIVDQEGFTTALLISVVMMVIMLIIGIIAQVVYKNKIKKYLK